MLYLLAVLVGLINAETLTPPIGRPSGWLALQDGEIGAISFSAADIAAYLAAGDLQSPSFSSNFNVSNVNGSSTCDVGLAFSWDKSTSATGSIWLSETYNEAIPSTADYFVDDSVSVTAAALDMEQFFVVYDTCADGDVYVMFQGVCQATNLCVSTAEFKVALTLFYGNSLSDFPRFSDYASVTSSPNPDVTVYQMSTLTSVSNTVFNENNLLPVTDVLPNPRVEVNTVDNDQFWLKSSAGDGEMIYGISTYVDWSSALGETNLPLYSKVSTTDPLIKVLLCYNYDHDVLVAGTGNVTNDCHFCYPSGCVTTSSGSFETDGVNAQFDQSLYAPTSTVSGLWVTTYIQESSSLPPYLNTHSVCHNWGAVCSPASLAMPSLFMAGVLAFVALF